MIYRAYLRRRLILSALVCHTIRFQVYRPDFQNVCYIFGSNDRSCTFYLVCIKTVRTVDFQTAGCYLVPYINVWLPRVVIRNVQRMFPVHPTSILFPIIYKACYLPFQTTQKIPWNTEAWNSTTGSLKTTDYENLKIKTQNNSHSPATFPVPTAKSAQQKFKPPKRCSTDITKTACTFSVALSVSWDDMPNTSIPSFPVPRHPSPVTGHSHLRRVDISTWKSTR